MRILMTVLGLVAVRPLTRQPIDTLPPHLLGTLPAMATACVRTPAPFPRTGSFAGATDLALKVGDPLIGWRTATVTVAPNGRVLQYREAVDRPERAWLQVWFTAGRPTRAAVTHYPQREEITLSPEGMARAATLAAVLRDRCGGGKVRLGV